MDAKEMNSEKMDRYLKEEEGHSHTFAYITGKGSQREITCTRAQTILDALLTSSSFSHKNNVKKVKDKELVILRDKKAITTHFPCWLIGKDDLLTIEYVKTEGNSEPPKSLSGSPQLKPVVLFHVKAEGGLNIKYNILNNKNLKLIADEVTVYAYEGEKVEEALKRDGRFKSDVFSKCSLKNVSNDRITEMSSRVNNLDGKTFKLKRDDKYASLKSQSNQPVPCTSTSTSTNSTTTCISSPRSITITSPSSITITSPSSITFTSPSSSTTSPQQSATTEHTARQNSKEILALLRVQFKDLVKHMKDREGKSKSTKELFRVEYGKNLEKMGCMDVKMARQLMVRAHSVCQVRVEGKPLGSGFLLFDKFILTCAHVIEKVFQVRGKRLTQEVTVSFHFEDLESEVDSVTVKRQVVVFEKLSDNSGCIHDWALLELDSHYTGLLSNFVASAPTRGGICIIGHPNGGVKKFDPCFTIPVDDRVKVADDRYKERHHLITEHYFEPSADLKHLVNQSPDLAYDTCFFYLASGSPVFDEFCNLVAMHTGGYAYKTQGGQTQSFIEYAQPLSRMLPRIIIQIVERQRFDVLEAYLQYTSIHKHDTYDSYDQVKEDVKRMVERPNRFAFENILKKYDGDSENIMEFIQFMDSEPMEM